LREFTGVRVVTKGSATWQLIRFLNNNGAVGILLDQEAARNGKLVPLFSRLASTNQGPLIIGQRSQAAILPAFTIRTKDGSHHIHIKPNLELKDTFSIEQALIKYNNYLESYVKQYPQQWLWFHKRWKSSPNLTILILSDGRPGHFRQSRYLAQLAKEAWLIRKRDYWKDTDEIKKITPDSVKIVEIKVSFCSRISKKPVFFVVILLDGTVKVVFAALNFL
jgi:hypothetical protein